MAKTTEMGRNVKLGLGLGILAGIVFAVVEIIVAVLMGSPPLSPIRLFASVVLGPSALDAVSPGTAVVAGVLAHLVLSALYGVVYAVANARFPADTRANWARQAALGIGFGALLWLLNFQVIARILYPWFLGAPQILQLVLHGLAFGLPLGLMLAGSQRRVRGGRAEAPA